MTPTYTSRLLDQVELLTRALREIADTARWYAENVERLPQEVDHALCVEVLSLAEEALNG